MRTLLGVGLAWILGAAEAHADGMKLTGSLWTCTRATDNSQFVITFYPGGGVGGGEIQEGEVSPYVFDASKTRAGRWPGRWEQQGQRFTWRFPDQHMQIAGRINQAKQRGERLIGTETSMVGRSAVSCLITPKLPRLGEGLVVPRDGHFMDVDGGEGTLKVPVGISLGEPGTLQ